MDRVIIPETYTKSTKQGLGILCSVLVFITLLEAKSTTFHGYIWDLLIHKGIKLEYSPIKKKCKVLQEISS